MTFRWIGKSEDGHVVTLHKLKEELFRFGTATGAENIRYGAAIDVETTGLNHDKDTVIEIGLRIFKFNRVSGELLSLESSYSALEDPGVPLSEEIKQLTGITDEMVKGQKIDWAKVDEMLSRCQVVIAHNASFDRPFVDAKCPESKSKIWGCSFKQVAWTEKGYKSGKLELLSIYHGFFTDAHRALNDSDALLYLLSLRDQKSNTPYLLELINEARKASVLVHALYSPFETKDSLKARNYSWEPQSKCWIGEISHEDVDAEIRWLEEVVYKGKFKGKTVELAAIDRFR